MITPEELAQGRVYPNMHAIRCAGEAAGIMYRSAGGFGQPADRACALAPPAVARPPALTPQCLLPPPTPLLTCSDISLNVALETMKAAAEEGHLLNEHAVRGMAAGLRAAGAAGRGAAAAALVTMQPGPPNPAPIMPTPRAQIVELAKGDEHLRRYIQKHM